MFGLLVLVVDLGPRDVGAIFAMKRNSMETMITSGEKILGMHTYEKQTIQQIVGLKSSSGKDVGPRQPMSLLSIEARFGDADLNISEKSAMSRATNCGRHAKDHRNYMLHRAESPELMAISSLLT